MRSPSDASENDRSWVARFRAGDRSIFDDLVRDHAGWAHRFALRLLRDPGSAEDAIQEAFIRAYRARENFQGESTFRTYFYRVVLNCCRDSRARRQKEESSRNAMQPRTETPATADPSAKLASREFEQRIRDLVGRLPPVQRETLALRAFEELSYKEIAEIMGVTAHAVKVNLAEARSKLSSWMGGLRMKFEIRERGHE